MDGFNSIYFLSIAIVRRKLYTGLRDLLLLFLLFLFFTFIVPLVTTITCILILFDTFYLIDAFFNKLYF